MAKSKGGNRPKAGQVKLSKTAVPEEVAVEPQKPVTPVGKAAVAPQKPVAPAEKPAVEPQKPVAPAAKAAEEPQKLVAPTEKPALAPPKSATPAEKAVVAPRKPVAPALELRSRLTPGAVFVLDFHSDDRPYRLPCGLTASHSVDAESGLDCLGIADGAPDATPMGHTSGYSIKLPDAVETAVSGRPISVKVVVRSADGADKAKFKLAYSTNDVGNSGWREFEAGPEWSVRALDYDVPVMKNGNGDFVGILPDVRGKPGIEVCCLAIHVNK